jgi:hypothetical protein
VLLTEVQTGNKATQQNDGGRQAWQDSDALRILLYGGENNQISIDWDCKGYWLAVHLSDRHIDASFRWLGMPSRLHKSERTPVSDTFHPQSVDTHENRDYSAGRPIKSGDGNRCSFAEFLSRIGRVPIGNSPTKIECMNEKADECVCYTSKKTAFPQAGFSIATGGPPIFELRVCARIFASTQMVLEQVAWNHLRLRWAQM